MSTIKRLIFALFTLFFVSWSGVAMGVESLKCAPEYEGAACTTSNGLKGVCTDGKCLIEALTFCEDGQFLSNGACVNCLKNATCANNAIACNAGYYGGSEGCTLCPENTFCQVGSSTPTDCPENSYSDAGAEFCTCADGFTVTGFAGGATQTTTDACKLVPEFTVTTTDMPADTVFEFAINAPGTYYIDWGDGSSVQTITSTGTITHTFVNGGVNTIGIAGGATGQEAYPDSVISFVVNKNVASLGGSLGALFPTVGENAPGFQTTFHGCSNLTTIPSTLFSGVTKSAKTQFSNTFNNCNRLTAIPAGLFADLNDDAAEYQFQSTFNNCPGLTGSIPADLFSGVKSTAKGLFYSTFNNCSGLTGSIPATLFATVKGEAKDSMFSSTFYGCSGLTGSIPADLFSSITSTASSLFHNTFGDCRGLTGSIPATLFATVKGDAKSSMFSNTFASCKGLTGQIPSTLFATVKGEAKDSMFSSTFYGCSGLTGSIPADLFSTITGKPQGRSFSYTFYRATGLTGYVPSTLFASLDSTGYTSGPMSGIFTNTGLATSCPDGTYQYITGFEVDFKGKVACAPCAAGSYCPGDGQSYVCPANHFCPDGATAATPCPANYFCPAGATEPTPCPDNGESIQWENSSATLCFKSENFDDATGAGIMKKYYNETTNSYEPGVREYTQCNANYYLNNASCTACPANSHSDVGATVCICNDGYQMDESTNTCVGNTLNIVFQNGGSYNYDDIDLPTGLSVTHGEPVPVLSGLATIGPDMRYQEVVAAGTAKMGVNNWAFDGVPAWLADGSVDTYSMGPNPMVSTTLFPESGELTVSPEWKTIELKCNAGYYNTGRKDIGKGNCTPCPTTGNQICPGMTEFTSTGVKSGIETCGANSSPNDAHTECVCNKDYYGDGTICTACPAHSHSNGGNTPTCTCDDGYTVSGFFNDSTETTQDCREISEIGVVWAPVWPPQNSPAYKTCIIGETCTLPTEESDPYIASWHDETTVLKYWQNADDPTKTYALGQQIDENTIKTDSPDVWLRLAPVYVCAAGYYDDGTTCKACPENHFCPEASAEPQSCADLENTSGANADGTACVCIENYTEGGYVTGGAETTIGCSKIKYAVTYWATSAGPYGGGAPVHEGDSFFFDETYYPRTASEIGLAGPPNAVLKTWGEVNDASKIFAIGEPISPSDIGERMGIWLYPLEWQCAAGYYGDGETCTACPEHSTSVDGATVCTCDDGYRMADNVCEPCPNGVCVDPAPIRPTCNAGYHVDESTNTCVGNTLNIVFQNGGSYNYEVSDLPAGLRVTHGEPVPVLSGLETIGPDMRYQEVVAAGTAKMGVKNWAFDGVPAWLADGSVDTYSMGTNPIVSTALFPESGDLIVSPEWKTIELKCNAGYYNTGRKDIGKGNCTPCPTTGNKVCPGMTEFKPTNVSSGIETCGANSSPNDAHTECVCNAGYVQDVISGTCIEKIYTITYDDNTDYSFNHFGSYTIKAPDARDGYVFEYWVDNNGTQYTAGQTISGSDLTDTDITLTGVWHCAANYYGDGATCTACPEHSTSTEGSDYCTCDAGYYGDGNTCTICLAGSYCPGSTTTPMACPTEYNTSDAGATQESECYLITELGKSVETATAEQTDCPAGSYCPGNERVYYGGTGGKTSCPANYPYSEVGSDEIYDCYEKCEDIPVDNGTAHPEETTAKYPNECAYYTGESKAGNPCNIITKDGAMFCYEPNCPFDQEMKTPGVCEPCNVAHADEYDETAHGNCIVKTCLNGYEPYMNSCREPKIECDAEHAITAHRYWDKNYLAYGPCLVEECKENYHIDANACESNISPCDIKNGVGERKWEGSNWSACYVKRCERGFMESDDQTQCVRCYNYYDEKGNVAVSSYIDRCEIATCMYQGEKYILEDNNECSLICTDKEDETGSRHWNEETQKCEHTCNDGYLQW